MNTHILSIAALALLCLALVPRPFAQAATLGVQIEVEVDSGAGFVSKGTALGTDASPLDVDVSVGDTVRFTVKILGTPDSPTLEGYESAIMADDPTEIDFVPASGVELTGLGFATDPNTTLTDGTPSSGFADSTREFQSWFSNEPLYEVQYTVQAGLNGDASIDFSVDGGPGNTLSLLDIFASDGTEIADVRLNVLVPVPALSLPGVGVFLLLAVAAIFVIRQRRSRPMSS